MTRFNSPKVIVERLNDLVVPKGNKLTLVERKFVLPPITSHGYRRLPQGNGSYSLVPERIDHMFDCFAVGGLTMTAYYPNDSPDDYKEGLVLTLNGRFTSALTGRMFNLPDYELIREIVGNHSTEGKVRKNESYFKGVGGRQRGDLSDIFPNEIFYAPKSNQQ